MDLGLAPPSVGAIDSGATSWVLVSAALILLMTPGLAFFYGGMLRKNNVLGIIMQSFCAMGVVSVGWALLGFSIAFDKGNPWLGGMGFAGLIPASSGGGLPSLAVPVLAFAFYQMMGAVITPALVTGATAERWRLSAYLLFLVLWPLLVYAPVAHWLFSPAGWANHIGALDFAGGMVVHANAGAAAIAMAVVLGPRMGWPQRPESAHSVPLVMIGTGLLWFGWIGYNGGSALAANQVATLAAVNTHLGGATALLAWMATERVRTGKSTVLGAGCGAVAGLVAVTPAAGYVAPWSAILIGGADGVLYGGGLRQLGLQIVALVAVVTYSLVVTAAIGILTGMLVGNRVPRRQERLGLDQSLHGEQAYEDDEDDSTADTPSSTDTADPLEPELETVGAHRQSAKTPSETSFSWLP